MRIRNRETSSITLALGKFGSQGGSREGEASKKNLERNAEMEEASGEEPFPVMLWRNSGTDIQN